MARLRFQCVDLLSRGAQFYVVLGQDPVQIRASRDFSITPLESPDLERVPCAVWEKSAVWAQVVTFQFG